jgi:cob(I)alamin adenosyltransferase
MSDNEKERNEKHAHKMKKLKEVQSAKQAKATKEKGLLIVYTGNGKGKSTAAFGNAIRALGHGMNVAVIQFLKGTWETGEKAFFAGDLPGLYHYYYGKGFTWDTQNRPSDIEVCQTVWEEAKKALADPKYQLVVLDEINIALRYDYISIDDVVDVLSERRKDLHVIATGRNAKPQLIDAADLVTEMKLIKHPYQEQGVKAQKGVEF